jgi:hypothetical protein
MGKFLAIVVVLAVVLGFGDVQARHYAERQLAHRIRTNVTASTVHVTISSFPFVGRLVVFGTVGQIRAQATNVSSGNYTFDSVVATVHRVKIDRSALLRDQQVQVTSIDRGTVTADMTNAEVDKAIASTIPGVSVNIGNGSVQATVAGVSVTAQVEVVAGELHVSAAGFQVSIPVPQLPLLPCVASATLVPGHLQLSCTIHEVPPALLSQAAA